MVTAFHALRTPVADLYGSRSNSKTAKDILTGDESGEPPLIIIPPPREAQQEEGQTFMQRPVLMRVGNLGEKDGSGNT